MANANSTCCSAAPAKVLAPRIFRIELDEMHITVHPGDNPDAVRELLSSTPPRYFIDDVEVDQATFDRELEKG